jgi:hypothetical protein
MVPKRIASTQIFCPSEPNLSRPKTSHVTEAKKAGHGLLAESVNSAYGVLGYTVRRNPLLVDLYKRSL